MNPLDLSPTEFEKLVRDQIQVAGGALADFEAKHLDDVSGDAGAYTMDATARFTALGEGEFLVLIECKRHKNPIKRELVQVLHDKLQDMHAQKAMMFATAAFQEGALTYAKAKSIALIEVREGGSSWKTKASGPTKLPPWLELPPVELWHVRGTQGGSVGYTMVRPGYNLRAALVNETESDGDE
jgi:restriction system protein